MNLNQWYARCMGMAFHVSSWSKDPSSKHGCFLVDDTFRPISYGYNGMPEGTDDSVLHTDEKYDSVIHAEHNAVLNAARLGHSTANSLAFVTGRPCIHCLGNLINARVKKIIFHPIWDEFCKDRWAAEHSKITNIVKQTKIGYETFKFVDLPLKAHFKGELYDLEVYSPYGL